MKENNARKVQIVETAMRLFRERGVDKVSIKDICQEMGITRSSFYYHYTSKEDVLDYYFLSTELEITEHLIPLLVHEKSYDQFKNIYQVFMARTVEWGPDLFAQIIKRFVDGKNDLLAPQTIALKDVYVSLIERAQSRHEIANLQPASQIVEHIVYLSVGLANLWCNQAGAFDYATKLSQVIDQYLQPTT